MENKARIFLGIISKYSSANLAYSEHFERAKDKRGRGEKTIEDFLFNRQKDLIFVEEGVSSRGLQRFKAFYTVSKHNVIEIIVDHKPNLITVVSFLLIDRKAQLEAVRNANKYAKVSRRLR